MDVHRLGAAAVESFGGRVRRRRAARRARGRRERRLEDRLGAGERVELDAGLRGHDARRATRRRRTSRPCGGFATRAPSCRSQSSAAGPPIASVVRPSDGSSSSCASRCGADDPARLAEHELHGRGERDARLRARRARAPRRERAAAACAAAAPRARLRGRARRARGRACAPRRRGRALTPGRAGTTTNCRAVADERGVARRAGRPRFAIRPSSYWSEPFRTRVGGVTSAPKNVTSSRLKPRSGPKPSPWRCAASTAAFQSGSTPSSVGRIGNRLPAAVKTTGRWARRADSALEQLAGVGRLEPADVDAVDPSRRPRSSSASRRRRARARPRPRRATSGEEDEAAHHCPRVAGRSESGQVISRTTKSSTPPETLSSMPVMYEARSEQRNAIAFAISCGSPGPLEHGAGDDPLVHRRVRHVERLGADHAGHDRVARDPVPAALHRERPRQAEQPGLRRRVARLAEAAERARRRTPCSRCGPSRAPSCAATPPARS